MSAVYPLTLEAFLKGDVDLDGTVKILLVDADYVYSDAHDFLNDVAAGARLGAAQTLTDKTFTGGEFRATSPIYTGVLVTDTVTGVICYIDTGVEGTSRLLSYEDHAADGSPLSFAGTGNPIPVLWPTRPIFTI